MTRSCPAVHGTAPGDLAVRSRAETNIVAKLPVVQVVPTAFVRHRKRRNLVVVKTCRCRALFDCTAYVPGGLFGGQLRWISRKRRMWFNG